MALYTGENAHPAHSLHYSWTGWPGENNRMPALSEHAIASLADAWVTDGLTLVSHAFASDRVQFTMKAPPHLAPATLAAKTKGRLQHALRHEGRTTPFSRKLAVRSLGENRRATVERYIQDQLKHIDLCDPRYRKQLAENAYHDKNVQLDAPAATNSGRYWYNLHVVLVTAGRFRIGGDFVLSRMRDACLAAATNRGWHIHSIAVMPDHVHVAVRGAAESSPAEIAVTLQNETARAALGCRVWQDRYYVGTFSEYDLDAVRP